MKRLGLIALLGLALGGCGYRFIAREAALPTSGRAVFAPIFSNDTSEAELGALFTQAFRAELADAHADGPDGSPVIARGSVVSLGGGVGLPFTNAQGKISDAAGRIPAEGTTLASSHVDVRACVSLLDGEKTLAETCVAGSEDYLPGVDPLQMEAGRRLALRRLAQRLMREAFERLSTGF